MRDNPYGAAPKDNPDNVRQAMSYNGLRQRGLFGAAWNLGYFAGFVTGGPSSIAPDAPTGAFGAIAEPADVPQPWSDLNGGLYPVLHVLRGLRRLEGRPLTGLDLPASATEAGFGARTPVGVEVWLANATSAPVVAEIPSGAQVAMLSARSFVEAAPKPDHLERLADVIHPQTNAATLCDRPHRFGSGPLISQSRGPFRSFQGPALPR